ncbi:kinase-like domain-containing protein [Cyathus striatus]|nr:kinase-like domain-containing protein [Cyathus striatus]
MHKCRKPQYQELLKNLHGRKICSNTYQLINLLEIGGFGATYTAVDTSCTRHAVKVQKRGVYDTSNENKMFKNEMKILKKVQGHRNVVSFCNIFEDHSYNYLVLEFCNGVSLQDAIRYGYVGREDTVTKEVFRQILDGVEHLHSKGIYHCDLKPHNIMYDSTIKLIDFGLSTSKPTRLGMVGTHGYMAPGMSFSLFRSRKWDCEKADIWALGMILMFTVSTTTAWLQAISDDVRYQCYAAFRNSNPCYLCGLIPSVSRELAANLLYILNPTPNLHPGVKYI